MSKIISFANQKGGVGKSTLTSLAAAALACEPFNYSVYVADIDQQQSLISRRLADLRNNDIIPPFAIEFNTLSQLLSKIDELDKKHDFIFIDTPGKLDINIAADEQEITKVLFVLDYLFIPIAPGNYNMSATLSFLKIALKVRAQRQARELKIYIVVNMSETRTIDNKFLDDELDELKNYVSIDFLKNRIKRYSKFRAADTLESLFDEKSSERAKVNFTNFIKEFHSKIIK